MQKHRESVQAGVRGTFNPAVGGDDGFIRRSSYNGEAQMAAAMADKLPPPVVCHEISYHPTLDFIILLIIHPFATYTQVDIHDYHPPKMSSDDVFFGQVRRTSETIKANPYANIPPPPVVDINDYVAPKMSSDDVFFGQKRRTSEHINANAYAHAVPPPVVDINDYVPPKMSTDDVFFGQQKWTAAQIAANPMAAVPPPPAVTVNYGDHVRRTSGVITLPSNLQVR